MQITEKEKKKYIAYSLIAVCAVVLIVLASVFLIWWENNHGKFNGPPPEVPPNADGRFDDGYELKKSVETFLLIGYDNSDEAISGEYRNNKVADMLMLFVFDNEAKKFTVLQIDKDTMAKIDVLGALSSVTGETTEQIALSHTYGADGAEQSAKNVANAVSKLLLGVKIDTYLSLSMDALSKYNDEMLGGVEVEVLDDLTSVDSSLVKGENVNLIGGQALAYIKNHKEMSNGSNKALMDRQMQYIKAMNSKSALLINQDPDFILNSGKFMIDKINSNKDAYALFNALNGFSGYELSGNVTLAGEYKSESKLEFYPSEEAIKDFVLTHFYKPLEQ